MIGEAESRKAGETMRSILEIGGRRLPFLRWSVVRMALGARNLTRDWQVGDGREQALADHVSSTPGEATSTTPFA